VETDIPFWSYLTQFFLEWENFHTKFVEKIKTHIFVSKSCGLWDSEEKCCTAGQGTDDNMIPRMRLACWMTKATDTHLECVILATFPRQQYLRDHDSVLRYITYIACLVSVTATQYTYWPLHSDAFFYAPLFSVFFALAPLANIRHLVTSSHFSV
jgi:hypothetical protein